VLALQRLFREVQKEYGGMMAMILGYIVKCFISGTPAFDGVPQAANPVS
jgi:hypothetical protein